MYFLFSQILITPKLKNFEHHNQTKTTYMCERKCSNCSNCLVNREFVDPLNYSVIFTHDLLILIFQTILVMTKAPFTPKIKYD